MSADPVILSKTYTAHDKTFDRVILREPTYKEIYLDDLGRPRDWQQTATGSPVLVTYPSVVDAYLQRIVVEPGYECILGLNAVDAQKLEHAVCAFFLDTAALKTPSTSSSSASAGRRRKSKA